MVFYGLGLGLVVGATIPIIVDQTVYMTIANSFLRPHLHYQIEKEKIAKEKAIPVGLLDLYVKDVVGSFLLFWVAIGPVLYHTYVKKEPLYAE